MIKTKTLEQSTRRRAKGSIMAYLDGENGCDEKWIVGVLRKSGPNLEEIKSTLDSLRGYGNSECYQFLAAFVGLNKSIISCVRT